MRTWIEPLFIKRWQGVSLCLSFFFSVSAQRNITIHSDTQSLYQGRYIVFNGSVAAQVGEKLQLKTSQLCIDPQTQQIIGQQPLSIIYSDWAGSAQSGRVHWRRQAGSFHDVVIRGAGGVIRAKSLSSKAADVWQAGVVSWTGCAGDEPHWTLQADSALLKDRWLTLRGVSWRVAQIPIFYLPWVQVPLDHMFMGSSLLPKISYDDKQGWGVRQHLMVHFNPASNARFGVNWRSRRGAVWDACVQNIVDQDHQGRIHAWYGIDRQGRLDRFTGKLARETEYWLQAKGVHQLAGKRPVLIADAQYGSDKRVTEQFFMAPSGRDDCHRSTAAIRWQSDEQLFNAAVRHDLYVRNTFAPTLKTRSITQGNEEYTVRRVYYVPQVQWATTWQSWVWPVSGVIECGADWTVVRQAAHAIVYDRERSDYQKESQGLHMGRAWCQATCQSSFVFPGGRLHFECEPYVQVRARGYAAPRAVGGWCSGVDGRIQLQSAPFVMRALCLQPWAQVQRYGGDPVLDGYQVDEYERCARGTVGSTGLHGTWLGDQSSFSCSVAQPWALGSAEYLPWWQQSLNQEALMPLQIDASVTVPGGAITSSHRYSWQRKQFVQHQVDLSLQLSWLQITGSVAQYEAEYARARKLFCSGGAFVSCGVKCYLGRNVWWWLNGAWAHEAATGVMRGLKHELAVSYRGHCWTVSTGYKDMCYQHYGRQRTQWSLYLKISFSGLGTVGTAFKKWLYE